MDRRFTEFQSNTNYYTYQPYKKMDKLQSWVERCHPSGIVSKQPVRAFPRRTCHSSHSF